MLFKGQKIYSILLLRCPRCHEDPFLARKVYDFSAFTKVRKECPNCQLNYHIEPRFYYGSMYVAYALGVALMVGIIGLNFMFFPTFDFTLTFGMIILAVLACSPLMNALAKIIWANFFFHYQSDWKNK